jgi:hypothetical protein
MFYSGAIQLCNRASSEYRVSRTPENWKRLLRNRASQIMRSDTRRFAGRFLDLSGDPKSIWYNIRSFGLMREGFDNVAYRFSADELNT